MNLVRVQETATRLVKDHNLPGLVVGVGSSDGVAFAEGFGFANIESKRHQSPSIGHRIGSVTKTMTALCVMGLLDEGRLSLDDRVRDLLPDLALRGHGEELCIRHLLLHVGGIGEVPSKELVSRADEIIRSVERLSVSMPEIYPDGIEIEVPTGTKWSYANRGYGLLGEILMRIEGVPLNEVMRAQIFEPLGMKNSDVLDRRRSGLSRCYVRAPDGDRLNVPLENFFHIRGDALRAAGGGQSTMHDMLRFASALLRDGAGIVSPETYRLMIKPHWCPDPRLMSQAFGFRRWPRFGRLAIVHAGSMQGWATMLTVVPSDDVALVTFVNLASADLRLIDSILLQAVLDAPDPARPDIAVDRSILAAAPGTYECLPGLLTNLRVIHDQGRVFIEQRGADLYLRAQRGPWSAGIRMRPADESDPSFFYLDTEGVETTHLVLVRDASGGVTRIKTDGIVELVRAPGQ